MYTHGSLVHVQLRAENATGRHKQLAKLKLASAGGSPPVPLPGMLLQLDKRVHAMFSWYPNRMLLQSVSAGTAGEWHCRGAPCDGQTAAASGKTPEQSPGVVPAGMFTHVPNPIVGGHVQ